MNPGQTHSFRDAAFLRKLQNHFLIPATLIALAIAMFWFSAAAEPPSPALPWSVQTGWLVAVLWIACGVPKFLRLDDDILAIARRHRRRYTRALGLAGLITLWLWGAGILLGSVIVGSMAKVPSWRFPVDKMADPGILVGTFLGSGTIFALIITFAEVREHLKPRAMSFEEALIRASDFIEEFSKKECKLSLCSYYPPIGAVTADEYPVVFRDFCNSISTHAVKCLCLPLDDNPPINGDQLHALSDTVRGCRPTNVSAALAAFARMWYFENDTKGEQALKKFTNAYNAIKVEVNRLSSPHIGDLVEFAKFVPDFHFILAMTRDDRISAGFLLIPLRPAGMPKPSDVKDRNPPMVGMEVHDPDILNHLRSLYTSLRISQQVTDVLKPEIVPPSRSSSSGN